jgi:hypothetical protein
MDLLNNNKIVTGLAMLFLNVGAKYVQADLGKVHEMLLSNEYVKKIIVFCLFFVATRDISIAFLLTIFYILVIDGMLHEKRKFCLIPRKFINNSVNNDEYEKAKAVVKMYENKNVTNQSPTRLYENYISKLSLSR